MKTHIPDHDTGRTYCGRGITKPMMGEVTLRPRPHEWSPPCIDLRRDCIEDATCAACQRADDRRQADEYRRDRAERMFRAACRWAARLGAVELSYSPRRQVVSAIIQSDLDPSWYTIVARIREDLELDAEDER